MKIYSDLGATTVMEGNGILNSAINKLPVELHIPGNNYCGPGAKLEKRLAQGDKGINELDKACKKHNIAYSHTLSLNFRHEADRILAKKAMQRFKQVVPLLGKKWLRWELLEQ